MVYPPRRESRFFVLGIRSRNKSGMTLWGASWSRCSDNFFQLQWAPELIAGSVHETPYPVIDTLPFASWTCFSISILRTAVRLRAKTRLALQRAVLGPSPKTMNPSFEKAWRTDPLSGTNNFSSVNEEPSNGNPASLALPTSDHWPLTSVSLWPPMVGQEVRESRFYDLNRSFVV